MCRMKLCYITRRSVLALCVHFVYKGVRTSHGTSHGLRCAWIASPQNKGMSDIPTAPQSLFHLPESHVNLPGLQ